MSPRTKEQVNQIREQSKTKILDAALLLFSRMGYSGTTISAIAKEASISKGLLYNYFKGKEDLLHGIVQGAMAIGDEILDEDRHQGWSPQEILGDIIDGVFETVQTNRPFWRLIFQLTMQEGILDMVKEAITEQQENQLRISVHVFSQLEVEEPEREAYLFAAILDGMALQYVSMPENYPLQEQVIYLKKRFNLLD